MLCFDCGKGRLKLQVTPITNEFRGETITVEVEALVCPKCGYQTLPAKGSGAYGKVLVEAWREKRNLLTGGAIRELREKLGLSQKKFAEYLKVGSASVKRWEGSLIQDEAMDELIRLKTDPDYARRNYESVCKASGVEAAQPAAVTVPYRKAPEYKIIRLHAPIRELPANPEVVWQAEVAIGTRSWANN